MVDAVRNSPSLVIIGAGGFGREVAAAIRRYNMPFKIAGHIDDEKSGPHILGLIVDHVPIRSMLYVTAFGSGASRFKVRSALAERGAQFASVTSPDAMNITSTKGLTNGLFLGNCSISSDVEIGSDVLIQTMAVIGHDVSIGDGVTISAHAFLGGEVKLERLCTIHPHAVVLPRVKIGEGAVVGAGAIVIKDVDPYTTVFGSPAKVIAYGKPHD